MEPSFITAALLKVSAPPVGSSFGRLFDQLAARLPSFTFRSP